MSVLRLLTGGLTRLPGISQGLAYARTRPALRRLARLYAPRFRKPVSSWKELTSELRLVAEDGRPVVAGPFADDVAVELLYWIPFLRWALRKHGIDPDRVTAVSRGGAAAWYAGVCGSYIGGTPSRMPRRAHRLCPEALDELTRDYRSGGGALRPVVRHAVYERLEPPEDILASGLPADFVAVDFRPTKAFPDTAVNRALAASLVVRLAERVTVVALDDTEATRDRRRPLAGVPADRQLSAYGAVVARARGLVASYSGLVHVASLYGVPAVVLRSPDGRIHEANMEIGRRLARALDAALLVIGTEQLDLLADLLASIPAARAPLASGG